MVELPAPEPGTEEFNKCILRAIGQMQGWRERWQKLIENGATDEEIHDQLEYELGDYGSSGPNLISIATKGGANPAVWMGQFSSMGKPTIAGARLVDYVRSLLQIPKPDEVGQLRLF